MDINPNKEVSFNDVCQPGVFRIECIPKNKALFVPSVNVWMHSRAYFNGLQEGDCNIPELLEYYKQYGNKNFQVKFLALGEEYWDPKNVQKVIDKYKKSWKGDFYE